MRTALLMCGIAAMVAAQVKDARPVLSFEAREEIAGIQTSGASARRVERGATEGRYALEVRFESVERAQVEIPVREGDWRGYGSVGLDATNESDRPVMFSVEVQDQAGARTAGRTWWELAPREQASFALPLNAPAPLEMGMEGEPLIPGFRIMPGDHKRVDLERIAVLRIWMSKPVMPTTLVFDNIRPGPAMSYEKIVDRFGQSTRADWPGKVKSETDLKAQLKKERADLKARLALPDRDEYGGWAGGPLLEATGYFRTVNRDGRWWLVTPGGHLFFSLGLDSVNTSEGGTVVDGRERMFEWLPAQDDPLAAHYEAPRAREPAGAETAPPPPRSYNFYSANLERKYGGDWYGQWQEMTLARLRAWGFDTIGNWSDPRLTGLKRMPYTATLSVRGELAELSNVPPFPTLRMRDPFDPRFLETVDRSVRTLATERRGDPWLIGYYVDNELPWGFMRNDRTRHGLAFAALSLGPGSPAKNALVNQLEARYGSIEKLNSAWSARLASWQELLEKPYEPGSELTPAMREDMGAFVKELARRYFSTVRAALRKYDPNHLYLGSRFAWLVREDYAWTTPEVLEAAAQSCDVISFNIYLPRLDARWDFVNRLNKPAIIGEFQIGAADRWLFHPGIVAVRDQAQRALMYQDYVRSVAEHPAFIGCHFFKYGDEPLAGRRDGENFNTGFTSVTDNVYAEMVAAARAVHAEVYRIRSRRADSSAPR
jgi:hypothetical protein